MKKQAFIFIFAILCFICGYIIGHNQGYEQAIEMQSNFSVNN
jgi:DNA-directed RNA polymerase subunit N (RpoN/RPB10)